MSAHFLAMKSTYSAKKFARIFIDVIVHHNGILFFIISDRGTQFTSRFRWSFPEGLGTKVNLITIFHPQTDCQVECTIKTLEDILRTCIIALKGNWDRY